MLASEMIGDLLEAVGVPSEKVEEIIANLSMERDREVCIALKTPMHTEGYYSTKYLSDRYPEVTGYPEDSEVYIYVFDEE